MMSRLMPLVMAGTGETVRVSGIRAGWGLQRRLADMGLTPGVEETNLTCRRVIASNV